MAAALGNTVINRAYPACLGYRVLGNVQFGLYYMTGLDNGDAARDNAIRQARKALSRAADSLHLSLSQLAPSVSLPLFPFISPSQFLLQPARLFCLCSGCYKTHAERNQNTATLQTFHTNQELCFLPLPPFHTPSNTHTHAHRDRQPTVDMPGWPKSFAL